MRVSDQIARILSEKLHVDPPGETEDLIDAGILDSFAFIELLVNIEQAFGVRVELESLDLTHFRSIEKITSFIEASSSRQSRAAS
jgi:acyl carrier protein